MKYLLEFQVLDSDDNRIMDIEEEFDSKEEANERLYELKDGIQKLREESNRNFSMYKRIVPYLVCSCGETVYLDDPSGLTNECEKCGRLYNNCGQSLLPREMWEERYEEDY